MPNVRRLFTRRPSATQPGHVVAANVSRRVVGMFGCVFALLFWMTAPGWSAVAADAVPAARILEVRGTVEVSRAGATEWTLAAADMSVFDGDQIRTGEHSRSTLRLRDDSIVHLDELTQQRMGTGQHGAVVELFRGVLSFFHRDRPGSIGWQIPRAFEPRSTSPGIAVEDSADSHGAVHRSWLGGGTSPDQVWRCARMPTG